VPQARPRPRACHPSAVTVTGQTVNNGASRRRSETTVFPSAYSPRRPCSVHAFVRHRRRPLDVTTYSGIIQTDVCFSGERSPCESIHARGGSPACAHVAGPPRRFVDANAAEADNRKPDRQAPANIDACSRTEDEGTLTAVSLAPPAGNWSGDAYPAKTKHSSTSRACTRRPRRHQSQHPRRPAGALCLLTSGATARRPCSSTGSTPARRPTAPSSSHPDRRPWHDPAENGTVSNSCTLARPSPRKWTSGSWSRELDRLLGGVHESDSLAPFFTKRRIRTRTAGASRSPRRRGQQWR
jgi:hypothetical protein